ncbi:act minimal PKS chain-length factor (CLF/KS beta) [Kitasatospora sp. MAA4]|uniref:ketosynthase chain-length factor n=1 Tax=Kitasatospora sp. MAA4 TaxID=3035093 RepID=UPI0024744C38|nr:ketosynthase chain-length factor [Kitasatospora sp. MAA4]MDH6132414.1 act minimal PKS chain-length factor (CLF/KS beta) [Kitasatospora sp. MAA4]
MSAAPVVTGIGVAAPNGLGTEEYWQATLEGRGGIAPISRFDPSGYPVRLAGEVPGFDAAAYIPSRLLPQTDHMTRLALYAADAAMRDSGADTAQLPEYGAGVSSASSMGGFEFGQRELQNLWSKGGRFVSAYQSFAWFYAVNTGQISIRHGLRGPGSALVTDQAGGLDAVGNARRQIRKGTALMLAGGVDGALCPLGLAGQLSSGRLSTEERPDHAYLPFATEARGHVPGEGGAYLVLEDRDSARRRGARVYGEIAGYAATFDPAQETPGADGLAHAIRRALREAGTDPQQVDAVFADAAGVPELDRTEAQAVTAVFGARAVPVTAPKSLTGRLYAGGAALDLAAALLSIRDGVLPHTANVAAPAPGLGIDLVVGSPRTVTVDCALVLARGHGGFNAAAVVRRAH